MSVLPSTSPNLLQVCILAKLPVSGLIRHLAVRRQANRYAWVSLACLPVLASIATERLIKAGGLWQSQVYLYGWGVVFSICSYPVMYSWCYNFYNEKPRPVVGGRRRRWPPPGPMPSRAATIVGQDAGRSMSYNYPSTTGLMGTAVTGTGRARCSTRPGQPRGEMC